MATSKKKRPARKPRPDRYSQRKTGYINQSVRLTVDENRLIREAAEIGGLSINYWATRTLVTAAKKQIAAAASTNT